MSQKQRASKDGQNINSKLLGANLADINIEKFRDLTQYNKEKYQLAGKLTIPLLKTITNKFSPSVMFTIVLPSQAISNIEPLSECINLMILNMSRNAIENTKPLSKLKKLKIVNLSDNAITNIDCFQNCQDLVNLRLEGNMVKGLNSITSLSSCTNLKNLHFQTLSGDQQNPICELNNYRNNVLEFLPFLNRLDCIPRSMQMSNGSQLKLGKKKQIKIELKSIGPFYTNKFPSTTAYTAPSFPGEQPLKKSINSCKSAISDLQIRLKAAMAL